MRASKSSRRFFEPVRVMQGGPQIVQQIRQIGLQPRGILVSLECAGIIACVGQSMSQYLLRFGIAAFQLERDATRHHGLSRSPQRQKRVSVMDMKFSDRAVGDWRSRSRRTDRPLDPPHSLGWLAHLQQ